MDGHAGFGSREFELALLDDMYDQARSRTEAALRALGATREQATQAKERRRTRSPWSFGDYAAVLGAPLSRRPHAGGGHRLRWPVSVWPELCFEVVEFPGTTLMNEGLNRRDEARAPRLETIEDIKTWAVTLHETEQRFGPLRHADGFHMSWLFKDLEAPDATGHAHTYRACFVWGLVQHIRKLDQTRGVQTPPPSDS